MKLRLTSRIVLSFTLLAVILLLTVSVLSFQRGRESLKAAAVAEMLALANEKEARLNAWIDERANDVRQIAAEVDLAFSTEHFTESAKASASIHKALQRELQIHLESAHAEFVEFSIVNLTTRRVVLSTSPNADALVEVDDIPFNNDKRGTFLQPPHRSAASDPPSMTIAAPLRDARGNIHSLLAARVHIDSLNTIARRQTGLHSTMDAYLVNAAGFVVTQPRFIREAAVLSRKLDTEPVELATAGKNGVTFSEDYRGVPSIAVHRWLTSMQLGLIVELTEAEALAPVYKFGRSVIVVSVLTMVATLLVAFLVARTITKPLLTLRQSVQRFGDISSETDQARGDEVSVLRHAFDRMLLRVEQRTRELAASNEALRGEIRDREASEQLRREEEARYQRQRDALIDFTGRGARSGGNLTATMQQLVELAAQTLGVARASVWLFTEDGGGIRCLDLYEVQGAKHSAGLELPSSAFPAYFRALGELKLIDADDAHQDPRTSEFSEPYLTPLGITSMLDAPVHMTGAPAGVLCHEHIGPPRQWTPDEKTFAVAVADLVSLALEGAERRRAEEELRKSEQEVRTAHARLELMVEYSPAVMYQLKVEAQRVYPVTVSANVLEMLGYSPAEAMDENWWMSQLHPDDKARVLAVVFDGLPSTVRRLEYRLRRKDGVFVWIDDCRRLVLDSLGIPSAIVGLWVDITAHKETELELQRYRAELEQRVNEAHNVNSALQRQTEELQRFNAERVALSNLNDLLTACASADDAYAVFSRAAATLFPASSGVLHVYPASRNQLNVAASWGHDIDTATPLAAEQCWALRRGKSYVGDRTGTPPCAHHGVMSDSATLCVPLTAHSEVLGVLHLRTEDGAGVHSKLQLATLVGDALAISLANLRLRHSLKALAIRDPLTGLFNRRYLDETLSRECARATRDGSTIAVLMLDIDNFKDYNNAFGHAAGDAVLQELGAVLMRSARTADIACRYGGEEFCLVLPLMNMDAAVRRAEDIRGQVAQLEVRVDGRALGPVTVSLGVAVFPDHGDASSILRSADQALYAAKRGGRNRVAAAMQPALAVI